MSAFWSDMSYRTLIHELGCDQSKITKELFDNATRHTSGKEAVRAIFLYGDGTTVPGGSRGGGAPPKSTGKGTKVPNAAKGVEVASSMGHSYRQL
jgi:hypothetical protein